VRWERGATTLRDNLRIGAPGATDATLVDALLRVGLGPWLQDRPDGLDTVLPGPLSGSERRRLLIARALLSGSGVLLLEEPAEHLDTATAHALVRSALTRGPDGVAGDGTVPRRPHTAYVHNHARQGLDRRTDQGDR